MDTVSWAGVGPCNKYLSEEEIEEVTRQACCSACRADHQTFTVQYQASQPLAFNLNGAWFLLQLSELWCWLKMVCYGIFLLCYTHGRLAIARTL